MWADFHFLRPWWLLALLPLLIFLNAFLRQRFDMLRWQQIIDPALAPHMLILTGTPNRRRITTVLGLAGVLLITALAGPVWQRAPQPVFRNLDALVIVLDLSRSMDSADIKPSRLDRARFKIDDILRKRTDGQTALIAYAADAYVISPLTDDVNTIANLLPALSTDLMPQQGSRTERALEKASELLRQSGAPTGRILLITDAVESKRALPVVQQLAANGIRTSVLGVGTADGGPIPGSGGFVTQSDGSIVIAALDAIELEQIARDGDGSYRTISADDSDIDSLLAAMLADPDATENTDLQTDTWREEGPWLLLPLLPLAALAFRRGVLAMWLLVLLVPVQPARAFELADLWSRPDQRASRLLEEGDAAGAAELFADPAWKAAAAYRAGNYAESLAALEGLDDTEASYNRGNALAQLQRYDEAIAAYEEVLQREPGHSDAQFNLDLLKKLQQQQQQQQQQGQQDGQQKDRQDGEQQGQQDSQQQNPQDGQQPGQQDSQQENQEGDQQGGQQDDQQRNQQDGQQQSAQGQSGEGPAHNAAQAQPGSDNAAGESAGKQGDTPVNPAAGDGQTDQSQGAERMDNKQAAGAQQAEQQAEQQNAAGGQLDESQSKEADAPADNAAAAGRQPLDEDAQAAEQWLRKIPDDPGGLLRRKFYYQYQQQGEQEQEEQPW